MQYKTRPGLIEMVLEVDDDIEDREEFHNPQFVAYALSEMTSKLIAAMAIQDGQDFTRFLTGIARTSLITLDALSRDGEKMAEQAEQAKQDEEGA